VNTEPSLCQPFKKSERAVLSGPSSAPNALIERKLS
jgi:hypothetical protein